MSDGTSNKVLSAGELAALLAPGVKDAPLDSFVLPTAEELLALTEAALSDVDDMLHLTGDQQDALRAALRKRLTSALQPEVIS